MVHVKVEDVFGVSNESIRTYVEREEVDKLFVSGLSRNKHIVVYGASKQGKTALTNKHLRESSFIRVNCSHNSSVPDLYKAVLRQINIEFQEHREESSGTSAGGSVSIKADVKLPLLVDAGATGDASIGGDKRLITRFKNVQYNLALAQDVSELLRDVKFEKRIILENFHYLTDEVQNQLAIDLRIFEDYNILFIILGIWREKNRLSQYNGDLLDRLVEVPVEPWAREDLGRIIDLGEPLLNADLSAIRDRLIETCFDSVGVFQELCKESCIAAGLESTSLACVVLTDDCVDRAIEKKLGDYSSRHIKSLEAFVEQKARSSDEVPLFIKYYFVKVLFETAFDEITTGFRRKTLQDQIKKIHHRPDDVRASDMGYFLKTLVSDQMKKRISPPIFDFDQSTQTVKIIDSTFYFFIRNSRKDEVLENLPTPLGIEA